MDAWSGNQYEEGKEGVEIAPNGEKGPYNQ